MNLYIDPNTDRIVYLSAGEDYPSKSMVIDQGRFYLFTPSTIKKMVFEGAIPANLHAQNCWHFQMQQGNIVCLDLPPPVAASPTTTNSNANNATPA